MFARHWIGWGVVAAAHILEIGHWTASRADGQEMMPSGPPASLAWAAPQDEGNSQLQRDVEQLTRMLQAQQQQMDRQADRLERLQRELNDTRQAPSGTLAMPVSGRLADDPAAGGGNGAPVETYYDDPNRPWIDIGGQYRLMFNSSNFGFHPATISNAQDTQTFFNQRFRTWLTVRPNDNVEGYIQMEVGHVDWGSNFDFPKTYVGPRFPGADDRVGVELRRGWLAYQNDAVGRLQAGIQGWQDSFGQTLASSDWDFSVGGLSWARSAGDTRMLFGAFALDEADAAEADDAILFTLDLDWAPAESHRLGFSLYYLSDRGAYSYPTRPPYDSSWDLWAGLRAATTFWQTPVNAFVLYNTGQRRDFGAVPLFIHRGFAVKFEVGPIPLAYGEASLQTLYSTGDHDTSDRFSNEFRTVAQSARDNFGAQGYWSYLVLTSPHGPSDVNDLGVSLQNQGFGLFTLQGKYDYPISGRLSGSLIAGWLRSATDRDINGGKELGTELAQMFTIDFGGGLVADFGVAVLFTGDFYQTARVAPHPVNLWEAFTRVQLEF